VDLECLKDGLRGLRHVSPASCFASSQPSGELSLPAFCPDNFPSIENPLGHLNAY
jgi:hypothetical protein